MANSKEAGPSTSSYGGVASRNLLNELDDCKEQSDYQKAKKRAREDRPRSTSVFDKLEDTLRDDQPESLSPKKKKKKAKKQS